MNIADFKAALQQIEEDKNTRLVYKTSDNTVNVVTLNEDVKYNLQDHVQQNTGYNVEYTFYDSSNDFNNTPSICDNVKRLMPKMLNWRKVSADFYIWLDSSLRLNSAAAVEWMVAHSIDSDEQITLFKHPTRANIIEEVDYIESEIRNGNEQMIAQYDLDALKSQVQRYIAEFPYLKTYPLFDTRAFLFKDSLVVGPRMWSNFMLDWYNHTITETMNDKISLAYVLAYSRMLHGGFEGTLNTCNYIKVRA